MNDNDKSFRLVSLYVSIWDMFRAILEGEGEGWQPGLVIVSLPVKEVSRSDVEALVRMCFAAHPDRHFTIATSDPLADGRFHSYEIGFHY